MHTIAFAAIGFRQNCIVASMVARKVRHPFFALPDIAPLLHVVTANDSAQLGFDVDMNEDGQHISPAALSGCPAELTERSSK